MNAWHKWLIRALWLTSFVFFLYVFLLAVVRRDSHHNVAVENVAGHRDWTNFVAWKKTDDFTNSRETLLKINADAKSRKDFTSQEIQTLIHGMQSDHAYMREMSLAISQKPMSDPSKIALKPSVIKLLHDELPSVRKEAVIALFFVGSQADATNLDSLLSDSDPDVVNAANRIKLKLSQR